MSAFGFSKKQIKFLEGLILINAMALSLVIPSVTSSGELPATVDQPNELTNIQNGTATVTVSSGASTGTSTITYPSAYTLKPTLEVTTQAFLTITSTIIIPNPTAFFQSQPTTSWTTGMPATDTEIYGDANGEHRIEINLSNMQSFRFGVNCINPSNTAGAYLTIEYPSGGSWVELNSAQRFLIDNSNLQCPSVPFGDHFGSITYASIPTAAKTSTIVLRVDGVGGGAIGDTPSFASLWIEWSSSASGNNVQTVANTGQWRVCGTLVTCATPTDTLKTGFVIQVTYPIAVTSTQTIRFTWRAGVII